MQKAVSFDGCSSDSDCPSYLRCYSDVWWDERESFCDCDLFHGFAGVTCQDWNATGIMLIGFYTFYFVVGTILTITIFSDGYFIYKSLSKFRGKGLFFDSFIKTWSLSVLIHFLFLTHAAVSCHQLFNPHNIGTHVLSADGKMEKFGKFKLVERHLLGIISFLESNQLFNIAVLWIEVAHSAETLCDMEDSRTRLLRRSIYFAQFIFFLIWFPLYSFGNVGLAIFIAGPYTLGMLGVSTFGRQKVAVQISSVINNTPRVISRITNSRARSHTPTNFRPPDDICDLSLPNVGKATDVHRQNTSQNQTIKKAFKSNSSEDIVEEPTSSIDEDIIPPQEHPERVHALRKTDNLLENGSHRELKWKTTKAIHTKSSNHCLPTKEKKAKGAKGDLRAHNSLQTAQQTPGTAYLTTRTYGRGSQFQDILHQVNSLCKVFFFLITLWVIFAALYYTTSNLGWRKWSARDKLSWPSLFSAVLHCIVFLFNAAIYYYISNMIKLRVKKPRQIRTETMSLKGRMGQITKNRKHMGLRKRP